MSPEWGNTWWPTPARHWIGRGVAFDRELWAVREFQHCIGLMAFTVWADHRPLLGLRRMALDNDPIRQASWMEPGVGSSWLGRGVRRWPASHGCWHALGGLRETATAGISPQSFLFLLPLFSRDCVFRSWPGWTVLCTEVKKVYIYEKIQVICWKTSWEIVKKKRLKGNFDTC